MKRYTLFSALLVLVLLVSACAPAATPEPTAVVTAEPTAVPTPEPQSIVDIAVADGRFTTLVAALQAADLVETLDGEGAFTVFAPTDDAFAALPEGTVESLLADIPALTDILLYHVVGGKLMAADVTGLEMVTTLQGSDAKVAVDMGKVMIDNAQIVITDIEASNGVIHVIDAVILPGDEAAETPKSIAEIAAGNPDFSTLVTALDAAGLVETLAGEGEFTVFAPTNAAFAALPEGALEGLLADKEALTNVLLYHVVAGNVLAADVVGLPYADTLAEEPVLIKVDGGKVMVNNAQVVATDIAASNGVIHVIDAVLLPASADIVETAVADGRFTTLVAALQAANLVDALKGEGPFTVFAPTDDAFAALPAGTLDSLLADIPTLTSILTYHVVEGRALAADVANLGGATETLQGAQVAFELDANGGVKINGANIIITDILTANGVIHVIDAVILPPAS